MAAPGLSCSTQDLFFFFFQLCHMNSLWQCGIWFHEQKSNPGPLHWEGGILVTGPPGKYPSIFLIKRKLGGGENGASLVAQWYRIHLSMPEAWVQSLIWDDPTCPRETKPCATALAPMLCNNRSCRNENQQQHYDLLPIPQGAPPAPVITREKPTCRKRPSTAKNK